jgi:hypothetical protein
VSAITDAGSSDPRVPRPRREAPRRGSVRPVLIATARTAAPRASSHTRNLSPNGLLVGGPIPADEGEVVCFAVDLISGYPAVGGIGRVTRRTDAGDIAIHIERIAPHDRELLVRYLMDMEIPGVEAVTPRHGREYPRVPAFRPARVRVGDGPELTTRTVDVSGTGVLLAGPPGLRLGQTIWFQIDLGDRPEPVEAFGAVVRGGTGGVKGIRIDSILPADRERLTMYGIETRRTAIERRREWEPDDLAERARELFVSQRHTPSSA